MKRTVTQRIMMKGVCRKVEVKGADAQEGKTTSIIVQALLWEIWQETILPGQKQHIFIKTGNNYYPVYARRVYYQYYNQYYYEYGYSRNDSASSVSSFK